ncbi:MAG: hypothetical protein AB7I27_04445 [Bacteriovoracaceae bacterium]
MAAASKNGRQVREEREKAMILKHKFENRITVVRFAKESMDIGDYGNALKKYTEYLSTMAEVKKCHDFYNLKTSHFDPKQDVTEMLMISHVFFEMARMYDAAPKFKNECRRCLEQFVHFSVNQPFQVVNSELARKFLKKGALKNPEVFREHYQQIFVQSKKCYIVTFCFGGKHQVTEECREFKDWLLQYSFGQELVRQYYLYSSRMVDQFEQNFAFRKINTFIVKPLLLLFSKTILRLILK